MVARTLRQGNPPKGGVICTIEVQKGIPCPPLGGVQARRDAKAQAIAPEENGLQQGKRCLS
jgi:hypothetical protein